MPVLIALAAFAPMILAIPAAAAGKKLNSRAFLPVIALTALEAVVAALLLFLPAGALSVSFYGAYGLHLRSGGFASLYAAVTAFMWLIASLFSPMYFKKEEASGKYLFFWCFTLGATVGLFLSEDLFTAFLFFELLSLASWAWVAEERTQHAFDAGKTYLTVAVAGGMVLFMGMALLENAVGTLRFDALADACLSAEKQGQLIAAGACLLFGFGAKAGVFPLHIWLPKAHPVAPSPASALLSGVLTKAGVFGVIVIVTRILAHSAAFGKVLLILGAVTMVIGALLGVLSTNLKRTLACSSVSQIGFILIGLSCVQILGTLGGEGAEAALLSASGALLHMINHSLLKLLLFLCAGVVAVGAGGLEFDEIRGFGRKKPGLLILFLVGCLGIGGAPFFNGYLSKTLLHEGLAELALLTGKTGYTVVEWLFLLSGGMTVCYMAKLFTVLFIDRHPEKQAVFDKTPDGLKGAAGVALAAAALAVTSMGVLPVACAAARFALPFFGLSAQQTEEAAALLSFRKLFSPESLKGAAISIGAGALLFIVVVLLLMRRKTGYRNLKPKFLDMEAFFYKPLLCGLLALLRGVSILLFEKLTGAFFSPASGQPFSGGLPALLRKASSLLLDRQTEAFFSLFLQFFRLLSSAFGLTDLAVGAGLSLLRFSGLSFQLFDGSVLLAAKALKRKKPPRPQGVKRADVRLGALFEKRFNMKSGVEKAVRLRRTLADTQELLLRSFSFTMAMICVGLCAVLIYMML